MNHPKKNRLNLDVDNLAHRQIKRRKKRDLNEPVHYDINEKKVSVFTPEFLEENRIIDGELRKLRKLNNDYEEHNSVLETYIENLTKNCDQMAQNLADANDFKTLFTAELNTLKTELCTSAGFQDGRRQDAEGILEEAREIRKRTRVPDAQLMDT